MRFLTIPCHAPCPLPLSAGVYDSDILSEDSETQSIPELRAQLQPGERLAERFVVVRFLARGGMGEVYEVADEHLQGKHYALKTLRPETARDPLMRQRFEREVLLAREVRHPNVCPMYDIFRVDRPGGPLLFLTMKLLGGESLAARLGRPEKLEPDAIRSIARQMAAGLDAAHKAGVIHRDFKPGNVMLEGAGAEAHVSITDFGLSRLWESDSVLTQAGVLAGTIGYLAPEVLAGNPPSPAADVYAFGVVIHEMLTGRKPQNMPGRAAVAAAGKPAEGLPRPWDRIVSGCLEPDPARRFPSAGAALALIEPATRPTAAERRLSRRQLAIAAAGVAGAAAVGTGAAWLATGGIDAILHPLPARRFVALLAWPPGVDAALRPLLRTVLDAIGNRLARAESAVKEFSVITPGAAGQAPPAALADVVNLLGANLVLGASLKAQSGGYRLALRLFNAATGAVLRHRDARFASGEISLLSQRAPAEAAALLDVPAAPSALKDEDEAARLGPAAYRLFSEARDLESQPNDSGLDSAIARYQKVLESEPRFALGYADLALAYARKFQIGKDRAFLGLAGQNAALALEYNPQSAKAVLAKAVFDVESGNTQRATDGFAEALRLDPGNPQILIYKARIFTDLAQLREAEAVDREIIRLRPNYWPGYNDLGFCLYRQTRYREAADAFAEAAAVAPQVALPLANQGAMFMLLGEDANAEDAFRRSLHRAPTERAYSNLGSIAFRQRRYREAIDNYDKALAMNPKSFLNWRNLGDCYTVLGDSARQMESYGRAAETLSDALRVNPKLGANWAMLAFCHAKLGRRAEAEADLKAADERGLDQRGQFTKAQALAVLGRKQEALDLLLKCIDRGLSPVDVDLVPDLAAVRQDPRYRRLVASKKTGG